LRIFNSPTEKFCSSDCSDELCPWGEGAVCADFCCSGVGFVRPVFAGIAGFPAGCCGAALDSAAPLCAVLLPIVEKFHLPEGERSSETCGLVSVMSRISSVLEKMSGTMFTPTLRDSAFTNGASPNPGSSAMVILSAARLPDHSDRLRLPTVTLRPSAFVNSDSMRGRKSLTLITNGRTRTRTIRTAMMIAIHFNARFMAVNLLPSLQLDDSTLPEVGWTAHESVAKSAMFRRSGAAHRRSAR